MEFNVMALVYINVIHLQPLAGLFEPLCMQQDSALTPNACISGGAVINQGKVVSAAMTSRWRHISSQIRGAKSNFAADLYASPANEAQLCESLNCGLT